MTIKVTSLQQTCQAYPSQWEGRTSDKQKIYIRYRCGLLTCHVYPLSVNGIGMEEYEVYSNVWGDDGHMTYSDMLYHLRDCLDVSEAQLIV